MKSKGRNVKEVHQERKEDHLRICINEDVSSSRNYWDDVYLVHRALPEVNVDEVDLTTEIFGKKLSAPIIISAMTGGSPSVTHINENIARVASDLGIAMGVGSQRAAILDRSLRGSFEVVKDYSPPLVLANLGMPQFLDQGDGKPFGVEEAREAMEMVGADILAIHLNFLQEFVQPEGDRRTEGATERLKELAKEVPIVVKETGAGISRDTALLLKKAGVKGIDVGGLSGTSFSAVEYYRALEAGDDVKAHIAKVFWDWGIPTPVSLVRASVGIPLIATGGLRHGLDVARALSLA
ncbi:MAG: type 2 isopentenyl-diphosphate Delta-isomerase, partial [Thermoplasmata archaeon]|nr:type 2 isopentenyl-diphosphate Delta-isomerase [Thermoplasmata archaeon]